MTPLASGHGTLFDRLVARTPRPERGTAIPSAPAPVFDPFAAPREEAVERIAEPPRSAAVASDTEHAFDEWSSATRAYANDDDTNGRRMAPESHIGSPRRSSIRPHARSIAGHAIAYPAPGAEEAGAAEGIGRATTTATQRTRVSSIAIRAGAVPDDEQRESRQESDWRHAPGTTTAAAAIHGERLATIRPALDRWATFDDRSSPDAAATDSRAAARGAAIVHPPIGRATSPAREWPDEHASVVRPDLPIALPPRAIQAAPTAPTQEPIVHVTIGRLEIRGSDRNTPQRSRERPPAASATPLDQYLASRRGGAS